MGTRFELMWPFGHPVWVTCTWQGVKMHPLPYSSALQKKTLCFLRRFVQLQPAWLSLLPWGLTFISLLTRAVWLRQSFTAVLDLYARLIHFSYRLAEIWCLPPDLPCAMNLWVPARGSWMWEMPIPAASWPLLGVTLWILVVSVGPAKPGGWLGCSGLREPGGVVFTHWGKIDLCKEYFTSVFSLLQATQRSRLQSLHLYWREGKTRSYGDEKTSGDRGPSWPGHLSRRVSRGIAKFQPKERAD